MHRSETRDGATLRSTYLQTIALRSVECDRPVRAQYDQVSQIEANDVG